MRKWLILVMVACLLPVSGGALADADRFNDEIPQDLRALARQYSPDEDYIDCILFHDTPIGDYCLVLTPRRVYGYVFADGAWKVWSQVSPMERKPDMRMVLRRHAAGSAPGIRGACGLSYPDDRGFDIVQSNPGYHDEIVALMQFRWSDDRVRLAGWQSGKSGQFTLWEDGLWTYYDSKTGARLGGARIDRLAEYGLMAQFEELPHTLEAAQKMEAITQATVESLFPGWTLESYAEFNAGHDATAGYYRIADGTLSVRRVFLSIDAMDGIESRIDSMPVPLSGAFLSRFHTEDAGALLDTSGYDSTFVTDDSFDRARIPVTGTVLENDLQSHGLMLLTEDADKVRRLRWVEQDGSGYTVRSSQPLPEDTVLDLFHCGDDAVSLEWDNHHSQCSFTRAADGSWTLGWVTGHDGFCNMYGTVYCGVQQYAVMHTTNSVVVGSHPWRDMFALDFTKLPLSTEEAVAGLDREGWAVVNNPDPADRLHLRTGPDTGAQSLGKFYNRTPVQVLSQQGGWTRVRIGLDGRLEGWMMTKYLVFGSDMDAVDSTSLDLTLREDYKNRPLFTSADMRETTGVYYSDYETWIVGVIGDDLYILLDSGGNTGYLPQSWFWAGNG